MNIEEFADIIGVDLIIRRHNNQQNRYMAKFENAEVKEGIFLRGVCGDGGNPQEAVNNYVNEIKGKRIVLNATRKNRREFVVPSNLTEIERG